eukprot:1397941-Pyramimonas_sp.AAC.1
MSLPPLARPSAARTLRRRSRIRSNASWPTSSVRPRPPSRPIYRPLCRRWSRPASSLCRARYRRASSSSCNRNWHQHTRNIRNSRGSS